MLWKRITHAFLIGAGMSVIGVGCSAVNAVVSSSAGHGADGTSPQRLVAIGRVFENQGHLNRATAMYRQALRADPGNSIAQQRMDFIAGIDSGKTFSPSERQSQQAIAMADSIQKRPRKTTSRVKTDVRPALATDELSASLQTTVAEAAATPQAKVPQVGLDVSEVEVENSADAAFDDDAGWVNVVDTGWELAGIEDGALLESVDTLTVSPSRRISGDSADQPVVETVAFGEEDEQVSGKVTVTNAAGWKATNRADQDTVITTVVTLDEIATCMEDPVGNTDTLLQGLVYGEDDGVRALAATLLTECPVGDASINESLKTASESDSELLRLSSLDALIQRGGINKQGVNSLVGLLATSNPEIRIQAAASLRNCANNDWSAQCIDGLGRMLEQSEPQVVAVAASTLGDFGPQASAHLSLLQKLTESADTMISEAASTAISRIQVTADGLNSVPLSVEVDSAEEYLPIVE